MQHWGLTPLLQRLVGLAVVVAAAAACTHGGGPPGHPQAAGHPCTGAAPPASYEHVVTIVMENHGFTQIDGHSPFLNALARRCGLASAYHAVTHPSLPNYLAMVSGSTQGLDGSDCSPGDRVPELRREHLLADPAGGPTPRACPGRCVRENAGDYAPRHNPAVYFTRVAAACTRNDVPIAQLVPDLRSGDLAPYTFVTPNLCSDEHDCQVSDGDRWLARWVPRIVRSPAYRAGTTALFITYDEDDHNEANRVYTVVVAPRFRPAPSRGGPVHPLFAPPHPGGAPRAAAPRAARRPRRACEPRSDLG